MVSILQWKVETNLVGNERSQREFSVTTEGNECLSSVSRH